MAEITGVLGGHGISIESLVQERQTEAHDSVPVIILTGSVQEQKMDAALAEIQGLSSVHQPAVKVRVESLS